MADIEFSLTGIDSLVGKLESISSDMKRKGGRSALRKAAQLVADRAKEGAKKIDDPETGRSIADNIALRWNGRLFKASGDLGFRVGVLPTMRILHRGEVYDIQGPPMPDPVSGLEYLTILVAKGVNDG